MNYQGVNTKGRVVFPSLTTDQVDEMKANAAYNFVRFIPIEPVEVVEAPPEVDDAEPITTNEEDGANRSKGRRGRKTNRSNN